MVGHLQEYTFLIFSVELRRLLEKGSCGMVGLVNEINSQVLLPLSQNTYKDRHLNALDWLCTNIRKLVYISKEECVDL